MYHVSGLDLLYWFFCREYFVIGIKILFHRYLVNLSEAFSNEQLTFQPSSVCSQVSESVIVVAASYAAGLAAKKEIVPALNYFSHSYLFLHFYHTGIILFFLVLLR